MVIPKDMESGHGHTTNHNGDLVVVSYANHREVAVKFIATGHKTITSSDSIRKGTVRDPLRRSVCGVGYVGVGNASKSNDWVCYEAWRHMLERCYSSKYHEKFPSYIGCEVCDEWHNFQTFSSWYYEHFSEGKHLDKDVLSGGARGKLYSPKTCCFVDPQVNIEHSQAQTYSLISPEGEKHTFFNMSKFCRDNDIHQSAISRVVSGKQSSHKGWRAALGG